MVSLTAVTSIDRRLRVSAAGVSGQSVLSSLTSPSTTSPTPPASANPLALVNLLQLMEITRGRAETIVALVDGPVASGHPDLTSAKIREVPGTVAARCDRTQSIACMHGTFVAGILVAARESPAPAICPDCTLLVRPIFAEVTANTEPMPAATPLELATAITDCINAGARVMNISAALVQATSRGEQQLEDALDYAAKRGVIVVAAAGNQGTVGSSAITRHPWVIPVAACDSQGRPVSYSNLGNSIGRRGLSAPGENITSLVANGKSLAFGGTSAAAPFVTGAIALLCSQFPKATAAQVKFAVTNGYTPRRAAVVPPLLEAMSAYQAMLRMMNRRN